jgi:DNA-binding IclR family transcriptional regulator
LAEHGIPAVERAIEVMDALARQPGASIRDLANVLPIPRSTIYRILKSLEDYDVALRTADGGFELGPRLVRLARSVRSGADIVSIAKPVMDDLARALDCGAKLSVLDADAALVVAVSESPQTYSVTTQVGRRFPLHAGAASKILLAFAPDAVRRATLSSPLARYTSRTIVDRRKLERILDVVRSVGLAKDEGEFVPGVFAIARPVFDQSGQCVAALSIPFLETMPSDVVQGFDIGLSRAAAAITRRLGGQAADPTSP